MNVYRVRSNWSVELVRATSVRTAEQRYYSILNEQIKNAGGQRHRRAFRGDRQVTSVELIGELAN